MSVRRKSKRVEQIMQSHEVRRSPRLSQRFGASRTGDGASHPLVTISYAATSRSSLGSYSRAQRDKDSSSILNESGQSVPLSFDQDGEEPGCSTADGHPSKKGQGLFSTGLQSSSASQPGYISAATAQLHYDGPPEREMHQGDMPQHLYGLDESDEETAVSEVMEPTPKKYHLYTRERVITPPKAIPAPAETGHSWVGACLGAIVMLLYKCGSLLYLAATAMLCLDVVILHWLFTAFHALAGGSGDRPTRPLLRFWVLPIVLCGLVVFLSGGGLIPKPAAVEPSTAGTIPLNYSDQLDISALRAEIVKSVTATLQKDLALFHDSFRTEVDSHMEQHINKRIDQAILASEHKLQSSVKGQVKSEGEQRQAALKQLKQSILGELNSTLEAQLGLLQSTVDGQVSFLQQAVLQNEASDISKAMVQELVRTEVKDSGGKQIEAAREQWLKEAKAGMTGDLSESTGALKKEVLQLFGEKEQALLKQISSVQNGAKQDSSSLRAKVEEVESQIKTQSSDLSDIKQHLDRHDKQLASVQLKQSDILKEITDVKLSYLARLNALEDSTSGSINSSVVLEIFNDEMDKALSNPKSSLRSWLQDTFTSEDKLKELENQVNELTSNGVPGSGPTRQEVKQLIHAALARYSADRIGKFDFALENVGGVVLPDKCSKTFSPSLATVSLFGFPLWHITSSPRAIVQPQVYPGDCWAFEGSAGHALIKLKLPVVITGVTLEHIPKELSPNGSLDSAPKDFSVWGKTSDDDDEEGQLLGKYSYDTSGPPIQEYPVHGGVDIPFSYVLFKFLSNYGNAEYTCIYRVRVHGHYSH